MLKTKEIQKPTTETEVKYAKIRVQGLEQAIADKHLAPIKESLIEYLREEKDRLDDYKLTGIYKRY
ncbi:MAG: hypothetical protein DUD35_05565 [Lactobacillus sp.]|jgi:hypothetical protein|nr:MAG: hypothetical protein DUD35_05565 [Lactobacillus sp.]